MKVDKNGQVIQKPDQKRTVTCNRCGHLFGVDARLGISEVAGCHRCENLKEVQNERKKEDITE